MKNGVSAVLIARNEANVIRRCLESLQGLDQIVVYDTGSSDLTPDIARSMGADVHTAVPEIPFHFANARNAALAKAKHDWVLSIDADEVLREGSIGALRDGVGRYPGTVGYRINFVHRDAEGTSEMPNPRMTLFLRNVWTWRYRVHERFFPEKGMRSPVVRDLPQVSVDHFPVGDKADRHEQNMELLRLCIQESPEYHYAVHQLAMEHVLLEEWDKAAPMFERFLGSPDAKRPPYGPTTALMQLGRCRARMGDTDGSMKAFDQAARALPDRREALYWAALEVIRVNKPWEAVWWLEQALERPAKVDTAFPLYSKEANEGTLIEDTLEECRRILAEAKARYEATKGTAK
jgi:tetratricopeptide (TPR) repeat protein